MLVTIVFTTAALLLLMERAADDLILPIRDTDAKRLRLEASSALETTLAVLAQFHAANGGLRSPAEGWGDPLEFAGYTPGPGRTVTVSFTDESGKLSLPRMKPERLREVLTAWQLAPQAIDQLTDALSVWMIKDYQPLASGVTRPEDYERSALPFKPPGRPLRAWSELAAIDGAREWLCDETGGWSELGMRFQAAFSLYDYETPNVNAAVDDALLGSAGYEDWQRSRIREYVNGEGVYLAKGRSFFRDPGELAQVVAATGKAGAGAAELGTEIQALWVEVTVMEGQANYSLQVLVAPPGGAKVAVAASPAENADGGGNPPNPPRPGPVPPRPTPGPGGRDEAAAGGAKSALKYPFTVLEIRENAVGSPPVVPEPTT